MPGRRLLLVDDDPLVLRATARALRLCGFEVVAVANVRDAVKELDDAVFDVVVADLHIDEPLSGSHVLRHAQTRAPRSFRVLFTSDARLDEYSFAPGLVEHHVVKPAGIQEFRELLGLVERSVSAERPSVPDGGA